MVKQRTATIGLAALLLVLASFLGTLLARPPSPIAAADRFFERIAWRGFAPARPQSQDIVIVAVTDDTLALFPYRSPIDRVFLAQTIEALERAGVRAIGLDILLDQPTEAEKDAALSAVLDRASVPVVLITAGAETPLTAAQRSYLDAFLAGRLTGFANLARERFDDVIREHVPIDPVTRRPSLPVAIAVALGHATPTRPFAIAWRAAPSPSVAAFPAYPAETVPALPPGWLAGKVALIGALIPGQDEHRTVLSAFGPPSHGVEIHAHVLSQILEARVPMRWSPPWELITTAFVAATGMTAATLLGGWTLLPVFVLLLALTWAGALGAFAAGGPLVQPMAPTLALALASGSIRFWRGRHELRERKTLRQLFARFVSEPVVAEIWREREALLAGGRPRPRELTATVLFSDIAGFTPICERLAPVPLVAWLDRYIDSMVQVVTAHEGVVLRFIGDGILAVFGAPIARRDEAEITRDARNAVHCALAMHRRMLELNAAWRREGLPEAAIRVGLQTGPLVAGSLGNAPHMEYCLLGDTANTAARLEALGKQHAAAGENVILVGEPTWCRLGKEISGDLVGETTLKGKEQKVAVYRIDPASMPGREPASIPEPGPARSVSSQDSTAAIPSSASRSSRVM
jgi:adenylate cyclase